MSPAVATKPSKPCGYTIKRREGEMLILALPSGERVIVGLARVESRVARISINAPLSVRIFRAEDVDENFAPINDRALKVASREIPILALGPDSTDRLSQHRPTGS